MDSIWTGANLVYETISFTWCQSTATKIFYLSPYAMSGFAHFFACCFYNYNRTKCNKISKTTFWLRVKIRCLFFACLAAIVETDERMALACISAV
jgi:hypothetical protein